MSSLVSPPAPVSDDANVPLLEAPLDLIEEYLRLAQERREIEERLSVVRAELELAAAAALARAGGRGRFLGASGSIAARLQPTCVFDRAGVARELQRLGKLSEVAILQGPGLARYLAREPQVAARLGHLVRHRKSVVLTAAPS